MKTLKKLSLAVMLLGLMVILMVGLGTTVSAATYGDLTYKVSNGEVEITDCETSATEVDIPETIEGYPVTSIGDDAFEWCTSLTSITIPDSVTSIGSSAFYGCSKLTSITIPNSVKSIGDRSFFVCNSLTSITIPDSVTSIGDEAFYYCDSLTSITIPDSVTSIGDLAFSNCSSLTSITIPDSVTSIGDEAFKYCYRLTKINWNAKNVKDFTSYSDIFYKAGTSGDGIDVIFGNNVKKIPAYLFFVSDSRYLPKIKSVTIGKSVTSIGNVAFSGCTSLTSITIPNSVTSIGVSAFSGCSKLTSITIPDSVTSIGNYAFSSCTGLKTVTIGKSVTSIGEGAFRYCSSLTSITIPDSVTEIDWYAFYGCSSLRSITIPDSVTEISSDAFYNTGYYNNSSNWENNVLYIGKHLIKAKSDIKKCEIKKGTLTIADSAFAYCLSLTRITIPDSVTSIGSSAFEGCHSLTRITIPDSVTSIGNSAFSGCSALTSITIPNGLTSIGNSVFSSCSKFTSITIPNSVTSISNYAFCECSSLTSITIPDSVTSIGSDAFKDCYSLTSITIPDSVTSIGSSAFYDCDSLTSITIPDSVTSIGNSVFSSCSKLRSITIPDSVTSIGNCAFSYCKSLTSIRIPDGVKSIGWSAFYDCDSLTSIKIPDSVTSIGYCAFYDCSALRSITIPDSVTSIGESAFSGCSTLRSITIPDSVTSIGEDVFYDCTELTSITILNPDCKFFDDEWTIHSGATIYGHKGSTAQAYAKKYGRNFVANHNHSNAITPATLSKNGKITDKCTVCGNVNSTTTIYYPKTITLSATKFTYNGKAKAPGVVVKDSKGKTLTKGTDYTVTYSSGRTNVGKYAVTIKFKGNYSETVTKYFLILPGKTTKITTTTTATTLKAQWNKVTGATGYKVEVINSSGKVVKTVHTRNNYYTFSGLTTALYYKVKVSAYKTIKDVNNYSLVNATTSTYTAPSTPTLTLSSTAKGKANFSWSNVNRETGYQVYYSTSKNGTYSKVATYSANYISGSKSKLTSGKTYYFKVRAYKKVGNTVYYSGWSTVKSVKIK